jgi:biotin operon repressor
MTDLICDGRGWYKTYRQIEEWEWYKTPHMFHIFSHLLNKANFEDKNWEGNLIKRGQLITSLPRLSEQTGKSIQQIRTCLELLKTTGEILEQVTNRFRLITIIKYDSYQSGNDYDNRQTTDKQQTSNRQITPTKNIRSKEVKKKIYSDFVLPEKIDPSLWGAFEEMRKSIKAPLTDHAKKLIVDKIMRFDDPNGSLRQSIENTWRGVFPVKEQFKKENSEFI